LGDPIRRAGDIFGDVVIEVAARWNRVSRSDANMIDDERLLHSLMEQIWAIYRHGGDHDLRATVAAQMHEVCDRLPAQVARRRIVMRGEPV
jgi:hypothetical protein